MPALFVAATVAVSAAGAIYSGVQANQQAKAQAKMSEYNALVAERDAQAAKNKAAYEEDIHREQVRKFLSKQRALYGTSGVETSGSPLLVLEDTAAQGELDALAIRYSADIEEARYKSQAALDRMSGRVYKMQGRAAQTASYFQAGSTLLSGAGRAYGARGGIYKDSPSEFNLKPRT